MGIDEIPGTKPMICVGEEWDALAEHFKRTQRNGLLHGGSTGSLQFVAGVEDAIEVLIRNRIERK